MLDATGLPLGSAVRCNIVAIYIYIALYSKSLNPTLHISGRSSVGSALGLESKGVDIYIFTGEDPQSE